MRAKVKNDTNYTQFHAAQIFCLQNLTFIFIFVAHMHRLMIHDALLLSKKKLPSARGVSLVP